LDLVDLNLDAPGEEVSPDAYLLVGGQHADVDLPVGGEHGGVRADHRVDHMRVRHFPGCCGRPALDVLVVGRAPPCARRPWVDMDAEPLPALRLIENEFGDLGLPFLAEAGGEHPFAIRAAAEK